MVKISKLFCSHRKVETSLVIAMRNMMMNALMKLVFQKKPPVKSKYMVKNLRIVISRKQEKELDGKRMKNYLSLRLNPL